MPPIIKNMKVIEIIWVWVVFNSSLKGFGYFSGISNSSLISDPEKCSDVPDGEYSVV
jgi:hypothetical protein